MTDTRFPLNATAQTNDSLNEDDFIPIGDKGFKFVTPDTIRSDDTVQIFEYVNYYAALCDEIPMITDNFVNVDAMLDLEDESFFTLKETWEDHFVLYKCGTIVHWQLINNKDLIFVGVINEDIDIPL
jgi:hypothetical protein